MCLFSLNPTRGVNGTSSDHRDALISQSDLKLRFGTAAKAGFLPRRSSRRGSTNCRPVAVGVAEVKPVTAELSVVSLLPQGRTHRRHDEADQRHQEPLQLLKSGCQTPTLTAHHRSPRRGIVPAPELGFFFFFSLRVKEKPTRLYTEAFICCVCAQV